MHLACRNEIGYDQEMGEAEQPEEAHRPRWPRCRRRTCRSSRLRLRLELMEVERLMQSPESGWMTSSDQTFVESDERRRQTKPRRWNGSAK